MIKFILKKIWVCVFNLDANICAQCSYFIFEVKKKTQRIHVTLDDMSRLSTTPNRSQLLEQQSSFRVFVFTAKCQSKHPLVRWCVCTPTGKQCHWYVAKCLRELQPVLLIYEKRCRSCCECKTSILCFFMFFKMF